MNVLFLPAYFKPEKAASDYLFENLYDCIKETDINFIIYAPSPCRGITDKQRKEYRCKDEVLFDGHVVVKRFSMYAEGGNPIMRALRYVFCWIKQFNRGLFANNIDEIFLASTPPIQGMLGVFLKWFKRVPFIYDLQDIFPDSLVSNRLVREGGLLWTIGRVIENFTYKHADKIIVISEDFKKNIMAKGVPEEKIVVVYNWVDQNAVVDVPKNENKLIWRYGLDPNQFYITYSGNIGLSQNIDMLLDVFKTSPSQMKNLPNDLKFVLVGEGAYKKTLIGKLTRAYGEPKQINEDGALQCGPFYLLPFQPYEDISHVFSLGDVGLVISKPGVGANSVPSKTWSILSASRPLIANFDPNELRDIINGTHPFSLDGEICGIFTEAGDKVAFINAILKLYNNRNMCKDYGANGRRFIMKNLNREIGTQKYVDIIKDFEK